MDAHHVTLRELHRQDLLDEAACERRVNHLARTSPVATFRRQHQTVTLRRWLPQFVAKLRSTPLQLKPRGVLEEVERVPCRLR